jgi:predicted nucleic acid-binding protein
LIVLDTGVLVAIVSEDDNAHKVCTEWFRSVDLDELVVPAGILAEACYLIHQKMGSDTESAFLEDLAEGLYGTLAQVEPEDLRRMSVLVAQYKGFPLGTADSCVIATAERYQASRVATLDHRHFRTVKPSHVVAFELLPTTYYPS